MIKSFDAYFTAIVREDESALRSLLTDGIPEVAVDADKRTPLMHAIVHLSSKPSLIKEVADATPDINAQDSEGLTALHFATKQGAADIAHILLDRGAEVDPRDKHGNSPLFYAVFKKPRSKELIRMLIAKGADAKTTNFHGVSPESLAESITGGSLEEFLSS